MLNPIKYEKAVACGISFGYRESGSTDNPVLLLIHGNSVSSSSFEPLLNSRARGEFRLLAIDLPGHGLSDRAMDPSTYSLPGYAKFLLEAIDVLGVQPDFYWGWSLGGHILLEALHRLQSARGAILHGTPPFRNFDDLASAFLPNPYGQVMFQPDADESVLSGLAQSMFHPASAAAMERKNYIIDEYRKTDPDARSGLAQTVTQNLLIDEIQTIQNSSVPILLLHGEDDALINGDYLKKLESLWRPGVTTQYLPDVGHSPPLENPELCVDILVNFASTVMQS